MRFHLAIHRIRTEKHISQEELALRSDLTQNYISLLERNISKCNPTLEVIERIANALDCCPLELIECCHCEVYGECKKK
jgi:transcriptional regulator with XRE-family HTH domain